MKSFLIKISPTAFHCLYRNLPVIRPTVKAGTFLGVLAMLTCTGYSATRPNILIAITDDQSWEHAGAYGADWIDTPNMDRMAEEGLRFTQAYCQVPSCSPARATFLTGRHPWQLEEGSTLYGTVPARYPSLMDVLEEAGYRVGYTGKGWGPGDYRLGGRTTNPAGTSSGIYAFLNNTPAETPFCFWYGTGDPHRPYAEGSGLASGSHALGDVEVPEFLPDNATIRSDLLDYGYEIERFDSDLGNILYALESSGRLDNTIVIVTSDNGMPFPGAKANLYDHGVRVPFVVRWPGHIPADVDTGQFLAFADIMPTLLEACGVEAPPSVTGLSQWQHWLNPDEGDAGGREWVPLYLTRHAICRSDMLGYPMRAIRTRDFLYIRNYEPDRWPAGDPPNYRDIDASPSKDFIQANQVAMPDFYARSMGKRPAEELYDMVADPFSLNNLAEEAAFQDTLASLRETLESYLREQGDPLLLGYGSFLEAMPYTRSRLDEYYGGTEVLGVYHPLRLAQFKQWLSEDADNDGLANLVELSLFGDPFSEATGLQPVVSAGQIRVPLKSGVWPWSTTVYPVLAESVETTFGDGFLEVRIPEGTANVFFQIGSSFDFPAE
jgi:N-sulfoglucosamine sulfohydrolase